MALTYITGGKIILPDSVVYGKALAFDSDNGKIIISKELDESNRNCTQINDNVKLEIEDEMRKFMKYHRENIFRK